MTFLRERVTLMRHHPCTLWNGRRSIKTLLVFLWAVVHIWSTKKINRPHPFCYTTFVDHLNQGAFMSGKNETKRRQMKKIKDEINLQLCLMCDLLFFFFLQVLLKLRFLGKKQWKKKTKTKQKQKQWLKLNNNNPIQHIMIKLTSLKQLRRACKKKQTIFDH